MGLGEDDDFVEQFLGYGWVKLHNVEFDKCPPLAAREVFEPFDDRLGVSPLLQLDDATNSRVNLYNRLVDFAYLTLGRFLSLQDILLGKFSLWSLIVI